MRGWVWFNGPRFRRLQRIKPVFIGTVQMESFRGQGDAGLAFKVETRHEISLGDEKRGLPASTS